MPALKKREVEVREDVQEEASPSLRLANVDDVGGRSEVAALQSYIEGAFGEAEAIGPRPWPRAVSLPITVLAAAGLWVGIIAGVRALAHL